MDIRHASDEGPEDVPPGGIRHLRQMGLDFDEIWRVLAFAGKSGLEPEEVLRSRAWRRGGRTGR